jgi:tripartite-type tricarboxylate transporter receptor subunit TctC
MTLGIAGLLGTLCVTGAHSAEDNLFKGKRVEAIVVSSPGGGTDQSTRLVGRFLEKHLPGKPDVVYRNMPTGHGVAALNYFAKQVKPTGFTWVGGSNAQVDATMLAKEAVEYDPTKFIYFGGITRGGSVIILNKDKLANLTDKSLPPVVVGEIDGNRTWGQLIMWGADALGWNIKFVVGYPGSGALSLAARRGEIDMYGTSGLLQLKDMIGTGQFTPVVQDGVLANGQPLGRKDFPDVPIFDTMIAGKLSGLAQDTYEFWSSGVQMDKWYALPAGTPDNYVAAYRAAWNRLVVDPEFLKVAHLQFGEDVTPVTGNDVAKLVKATAYPRKEITAYMESLKLKHGLPAQPLRDDEIAKLAKERGLVDESPKVATILKAVNNDGRQVVFTAGGKDEMLEVSSSRTKVSVGGSKAARADLKAGMNCEIAYNGKNAETIACK